MREGLENHSTRERGRKESGENKKQENPMVLSRINKRRELKKWEFGEGCEGGEHRGDIKRGAALKALTNGESKDNPRQ